MKKDILQNRKLSDIICDNTDIEALPINIFDLKSETLPCRNRSRTSQSGKTFLGYKPDHLSLVMSSHNHHWRLAWKQYWQIS